MYILKIYLQNISYLDTEWKQWCVGLSSNLVEPEIPLSNIPCFYSYQYDLDGFPVAQARDLANRMKYHKNKNYKKCSNCENLTLNKPQHHFCCDCLLDFYQRNEILS